MQHDGAHDLHVEGTHAQGTLGALAGDGEGLEQQVVERLAARDPLLELRRAGAQLLVGEGAHLGLEGADGGDLLLEELRALALTGVQQLVDDTRHETFYSLLGER